MPLPLQLAAPAALLAALCSFASLAGDYGRGDDNGWPSQSAAQLGDRPFFLIDGLDDSRLKDKLQSCKSGPFYKSNFSIAHRGAPLQFPEHTKEA